MNPTGLALGVALVLGVFAAVLGAATRKHLRARAVGAVTALCGAAGTIAGISAMCGTRYYAAFPALLPLSGVTITVDSTSGLFLAVTGAVAFVSAVYGVGYARADANGRLPQAVFPLFVITMMLVVSAGNVGALLVCWELMALCSLVLVLTEHHRRPEVARAGRWYAVMTHLGFVAILAGLLVFTAAADDDTFPALRVAAHHLSPTTASVVFVATLLGFGSKAGVVPLHVWLPRAHPEAPSHVSALMSAAMVNLGVYGIVRVGFDLLGGGQRWWWLLTLALGGISAVYGILHAAMSTDLKRLLGYSTTENMGLVLIGLGAAGLVADDPVVAGLALAAALLHMVNHAAFKTVLFLAAGSVQRGAGSRDLDALGGLSGPMPFTTAAFGLGALAASALPPGTAFVSEWLLLQALIHARPSAGAAAVVMMPIAVAAVALTAGLAVATFVKAFGVGFLGRPRSAGAAAARESPASMTAALGIAVAVCAVLAVLPTILLSQLGSLASGLLRTGSPAAMDGIVVRLVGVSGALSPLMLAVVSVGAALGLVAVVRLVLTRQARRAARLWDCGAGPLSARMEYTATSFAEPLQRVFDDVVQPETDVDVTHARESAYLVEAIEFRNRVLDRIERWLYTPLLRAVSVWAAAARRLATGSVHRYLGYGFYTLCGLLILLAVTR
ncbi:proton-conducting transporter membrane subunit [Kutzneria buriramensis]|uniref:Formate hydrogenlyase subunit 3/multisubunit Na+/H+ antiporter MnhD subunit n=1 Tax=Kutzneria buriramensis TaxID=1045776 RepID=A0A3E0HJ26_9PSEU|nr:proton-conducting transporter membrane subunit [Kutzneria buriramensis]REH46075.1 formate hydrogenlyase subunit 3/multisubunit Na+/H+ antiporter MnhD subunit [Kutzneria buriramensis]